MAEDLCRCGDWTRESPIPCPVHTAETDASGMTKEEAARWLFDTLAKAKAQQEELAATKAELERVRRQWAVFLLGGTWSLNDVGWQLITVNGAEVPEPVAELVREYDHDPIGKCDRCGARAPLKLEPATSPLDERIIKVCAWGCASDTQR